MSSAVPAAAAKLLCRLLAVRAASDPGEYFGVQDDDAPGESVVRESAPSLRALARACLRAFWLAAKMHRAELLVWTSGCLVCI